MKPDGDMLWRRQRRLTLILLLLWLAVTFGISWFADELNTLTFFDFPLGFYMGAQGTLFIYLLIVWFYNRSMRRLEAEFGIDEG